MALPIQHSVWLVAALLGSQAQPALPPPPDALEATLVDGTTRSGDADPLTDEVRLRLRYGDPDAYIVFGIRWNQIVEIRGGEEVWTADRFDDLRRRLAVKFREAQDETAQPVSSPRTAAQSEPVTTPMPQAPAAAARSDERAGDGLRDSASTRVAYVHVEPVSPYLVSPNWNASPQWDGIVVRVRPMDRWGRVVPVRATLQVSLFSNVASFFGRGIRHSEQDPIREIGHWTRVLRASDFDSDGAVIRLEFQNYHPEPRGTDDPGWLIAPHGDVLVSLAVSGQGVFHASTDAAVRLRRFSPLRDQLLLRSGTRFFPNE